MYTFTFWEHDAFSNPGNQESVKSKVLHPVKTTVDTADHPISRKETTEWHIVGRNLIN